MELSAVFQISPSFSYLESESLKGGTAKEKSLNIKYNIFKKSAAKYLSSCTAKD